MPKTPLNANGAALPPRREPLAALLLEDMEEYAPATNAGTSEGAIPAANGCGLTVAAPGAAARMTVAAKTPIPRRRKPPR